MISVHVVLFSLCTNQFWCNGKVQGLSQRQHHLSDIHDQYRIKEVRTTYVQVDTIRPNSILSDRSSSECATFNCHAYLNAVFHTCVELSIVLWSVLPPFQKIRSEFTVFFSRGPASLLLAGENRSLGLGYDLITFSSRPAAARK
jgi:hypothetical protein